MSPRHSTSLLARLALVVCLPACGDDTAKLPASDAAQPTVQGDAGPASADAGRAADAGPGLADASTSPTDGAVVTSNPDASAAAALATKSSMLRASSPSTANLSALGASNRAFAFDLYHQLSKNADGKNLLFSPYSISTALAMTYAGARGTTQSEMKTALHYDLEPGQLHEAFNAADLALASRGMGKAGADGTPFRLNVDNSIWSQKNPDYPVVPAFLDTLAVNYGAGLFQPDFKADPEGARGMINGWVSDRTQKLIPELLPQGSIDMGTRFVLTNTVYFNASWQKKFMPEKTSDAPFTKLDGSKVTASMMHEMFSMPYAEGDGYRAVALPYASNELSFVAVLPNQGQHDKVEAALSGPWFAALTAAWSNKSVELALPKLDYSAKANLNDALQALGMKAAFTSSADLSGMSSEPGLEITSVVHQAVIKVIEDGTIAAAATGVVVGTTSVMQMDQQITFDRPFFIAIVDAPTGELLFVGRVLDPTGK